MIILVATTCDELELPIAVTDSQKEMAKLMHVTEANLSTKLKKSEQDPERKQKNFKVFRVDIGGKNNE